MDNRDPHLLGIAELARGFRARALSCEELTEQLIARIERLDPALHAFTDTCFERARAAARAAQVSLDAGQDLGPLHGIPYAAKDLFDVAGLPTRAGTHLLADNRAARDAAAIRRLSRAGMVLLGKTHTVQFAYGGVGINTDLGTPHNPWHAEHRAPGGSSSGSAVAVASGCAPAALGTDTGGSVRIPAALCGISGLKTTVGQVSRAGVYPLSFSLDSVGPLARSVEDCALLYESLQGADPEDDSTTGRTPHRVAQALARGVAGLRLRYAESVFFDDLDDGIERAVREAGGVLKAGGARLGSIDFPFARDALRLNPRGLVIAAEAYHFNRRLVEEHFDELDPVVAGRLKQGANIAAPEYVRITLEWKALRARAREALADVDALLVPTSAARALPVDALAGDPDAYVGANLRYLRNTSIGNILGLCAVSVPCGFTPDGSPIGLMIYTKPFREEMALRIGHAFQQATDWHRRVPALDWAESARSA